MGRSFGACESFRSPLSSRTARDPKAGRSPARLALLLRWYLGGVSSFCLLVWMNLVAPGVARAAEPYQTIQANGPAVADDSSFAAIGGTVVDEAGAPVPGVRVRLQSLLGHILTALTDRKGEFRFAADLASARYLVFLADHLKDGRKGSVTILEEGTLRLPGPVRIVLKPPRELVVDVKDAAGTPVADAQVAVSEMIYLIDEARTAADGTCRIRLPADAQVGSVIALKSGRGSDYWSDRTERGGAQRPLPERVALVLNGARTVRIRAVDAQQLPVPGITVGPWYITKEGRGVYANLSGLFPQLGGAKTDENGMAVIDWLPRDVTGHIPFLTMSRQVHLPQPPTLEATDKAEIVDLTMSLVHCTKISGTVYGQDGQPAPGILLQAEGRGGSNHYFRNVARTNRVGHFEFDAYPNQAYLVAVLDENWAAASLTIPKITEGVPVGGLELHLVRGTVLRGLATGADGRPKANATVTLVQKGTVAPPAEAAQVDLVRWAHTDEQGRYEIRVGPGTYDLTAPGHERPISVKVDEQPELIHDFRATK